MYGVEEKIKMASVVFLLSLFLSLVHCQQTFPYVSFMGQTLVDQSLAHERDIRKGLLTVD